MLHLLPPGWELHVYRGDYTLAVSITGPGGKRFDWSSGWLDRDDWQAHTRASWALDRFVVESIPLLGWSDDDAVERSLIAPAGHD